MTNAPDEVWPLPEYFGLIDEIARLAADTYYKHVFRYPMFYYRERVEMAGGVRRGRVLDAGQGYGQWVVALAEVNDHVDAIDHSEAMCDVARLVTAHFGVANVTVAKSSIYDAERLFAAQSFDLIWCWGVAMFVDRSRAMPIFNRLLKDGGHLLIGGMNTPTRWAYKAEKGRRERIEKPQYYEFCAAGADGLHRETGVNALVPDRDVTGGILGRYGFELVEVALDGEIDVLGRKRRRPFDEETEPAQRNMEVLLRKTGAFG